MLTIWVSQKTLLMVIKQRTIEALNDAIKAFIILEY
jgi:hypothetical protein